MKFSSQFNRNVTKECTWIEAERVSVPPLCRTQHSAPVNKSARARVCVGVRVREFASDSAEVVLSPLRLFCYPHLFTTSTRKRLV